jgi:hypothetical protein
MDAVAPGRWRCLLKIQCNGRIRKGVCHGCLPPDALVGLTLFKGFTHEIESISCLDLHPTASPCSPPRDKLLPITALNCCRKVIAQLSVASLKISEGQIKSGYIKAIQTFIDNKKAFTSSLHDRNCFAIGYSENVFFDTLAFSTSLRDDLSKLNPML